MSLNPNTHTRPPHTLSSARLRSGVDFLSVRTAGCFPLPKGCGARSRQRRGGLACEITLYGAASQLTSLPSNSLVPWLGSRRRHRTCPKFSISPLEYYGLLDCIHIPGMVTAASSGSVKWNEMFSITIQPYYTGPQTMGHERQK